MSRQSPSKQTIHETGTTRPDVPFDHKSSASVAALGRVKKEIGRLTEEQTEALKTATFVGLTPEAAKELYARRLRITDLIRELELYEKLQ